MHEARVRATRPFLWSDGGLTYIDQRRLPSEIVRARAPGAASVVDAILTSAITGVRSIDLFAAFGVVLARRQGGLDDDPDQTVGRLRAAIGHASPMPTLTAFERVVAASAEASLPLALRLLEQSAAVDASIARHASSLVPLRGAILTHGGTGALSTGGSGTAAGAIIAAQRAGKQPRVYVAETRPRLTGRNLTAYELAAAGVACSVISDGAAATLMRTLPIAAIIVGAEAIAANGDSIGEIGTYAIAVAAAHHRVPFYVATPRGSIGNAVRRGDDFHIPVEWTGFDPPAADGVTAGPAPTDAPAPRDLTPGRLITAIVTEYGITQPPYVESLPGLATRPRFELIAQTRDAP